MSRAIILPVLLAAAALLVPAGSHDAQAQSATSAVSKPQASEMSAQDRPRRRPRVYIERPPAALDYPPPGDFMWPGPGAVRHCADWYALEYRPSGTVLTPQMRCRWVRG